MRKFYNIDNSNIIRFVKQDINCRDNIVFKNNILYFFRDHCDLNYRDWVRIFENFKNGFFRVVLVKIVEMVYCFFMFKLYKLCEVSESVKIKEYKDNISHLNFFCGCFNKFEGDNRRWGYKFEWSSFNFLLLLSKFPFLVCELPKLRRINDLTFIEYCKFVGDLWSELKLFGGENVGLVWRLKSVYMGTEKLAGSFNLLFAIILKDGLKFFEEKIKFADSVIKLVEEGLLNSYEKLLMSHEKKIKCSRELWKDSEELWKDFEELRKSSEELLKSSEKLRKLSEKKRKDSEKLWRFCEKKRKSFNKQRKLIGIRRWEFFEESRKRFGSPEELLNFWDDEKITSCEKTRAVVEQKRKSSDKLRRVSEEKRKLYEEKRKLFEKKRKSFKELRKSSEAGEKWCEKFRKSFEESRKPSEAEKKLCEKLRKSFEESRKPSEAEKKLCEEKRKLSEEKCEDINVNYKEFVGMLNEDIECFMMVRRFFRGLEFYEEFITPSKWNLYFFRLAPRFFEKLWKFFDEKEKLSEVLSTLIDKWIQLVVVLQKLEARSKQAVVLQKLEARSKSIYILKDKKKKFFYGDLLSNSNNLTSVSILKKNLRFDGMFKILNKSLTMVFEKIKYNLKQDPYIYFFNCLGLYYLPFYLKKNRVIGQKYIPPEKRYKLRWTTPDQSFNKFAKKLQKDLKQIKFRNTFSNKLYTEFILSFKGNFSLMSTFKQEWFALFINKYNRK